MSSRAELFASRPRLKDGYGCDSQNRAPNLH